jgi:PAS domain S-box-containing protein
LIGGAIAMGIGIWAMHFKGMLAFSLPVTVDYHWPTVLACLVIAVFASAIALYVATREKMGLVQAWAGSLMMGSGIAAMHYLGMAAMRLAATTRFEPLLVALSVLLAILFSRLALAFTFDYREDFRGTSSAKVLSAAVMGGAISLMHYTGMAAASFVPTLVVPNLSHTLSISPLGGYGISIVTLLVLGTAILTSSVDRQTQAEVLRLNEGLEQRVTERTRELTAANEGLRREITERQRAEDAVRRSEEHLRLVIDTIPQQIMSGPNDGTLDFANAQWRSYTGLTQEELQGRGWQRIIHPDDRVPLLKAVEESRAQGKPFEQEVRRRGADGQYRWFLTRAVPLKDAEGHIVRWYGSNTDIQDRREAENRIRLVIDTAPAMLHSACPDGYVDFFNKRWLEYVGAPLEVVRGWGWTKVIHPDDVEGVLDKWRASLASGNPFVYEARVRRGDGEYRWQFLRKVPLHDMQGNIVKWYGSSIDIDDRKRAEEALRSSELEQRQIAEQLEIERARLVEAQQVAKMGSWEADFPTLDVTWSEQTHRIFETDPARFVSTRPSFREFIHPEDRAKVDAAFEASLAKRSTCTVDYRIVMPDGRVKILEERWKSFHDERGKPVRVAGTCRDITERVRAEEELRRIRERLESILNSVSDTFILFDRQWRYLYLNDAAIHATNRPLKEILGHIIWELFPAVVGSELDLEFHRAMDERVSIEFDWHFVQPGIDQWWEIRTHPAPEGLAVFATEITERKRAEKELRRLSGQLLRSQDEERRRIARDLHDSTGQDLVALATTLGQLHASLPPSGRKLRKLAAQGQSLAEQCIREVRTLSYLLHPPMLDDSGLKDALRHFIDGFTDRTGIQVNLVASPSFNRLAPETELGLFRVVQESLTNIQRHSGSFTATIRLEAHPDNITLEVSDTGRGFTLSKHMQSKPVPLTIGVGIPSMQERVMQMGGHLEIESSSSGTTVRVTIPL